MSGDQTFGFRAGPEMKQRVDDFKESESDCETTSDAVRELVAIGLRETRYPLLYRFKDDVISMSSWMAVGALVIFTVGTITNETVEFGFTLRVALVLVSFSLFLIAAYEAARLCSGQNELGDWLREWRTQQ